MPSPRLTQHLSLLALSLLALTLSLLPRAPAAADEPTSPPLGKLACAAYKAPADVTAKCDAAAKAESILIDTYSQVLDALHGPARVAFIDDHTAWVASRAPMCLAINDSPLSDRPFPTTADDFDCLAASATARERFARAWLPPDPSQPTPSLDGDYSDGWGGSLTLSDASAKDVRLSLSVVRSTTFHIGEAEGPAKLSPDGETATLTLSGLDPAQPCVLTLTLAPNVITVTESEGCAVYHGARAYFDGTYRKLPAK